MKNWLWIAGVILGVVVLASVLYFGIEAEQPAEQTEYAPTPTNALPANPERFVRILSPSPTETPTPTPFTPKSETTVKELFAIGDRTSSALTNDGILEIDFQDREYTRRTDYLVRGEESEGWDEVYDFPSIGTAVRFRYSGNSIFEQLASVKDEVTEYYSYFNSNALKLNDSLVVLSVPDAPEEEDSLMLYLRSDEARLTQNGKILATFTVKNGVIQVLLATQGQDITDYSRTYYVSEEGRLESLYLEETEEQTACYDRRTRHCEWRLTRLIDGERVYTLEARDPNSPEDRDNMLILFRGAQNTIPTEVYGVTNTAFSLWDRIEEAESNAQMPKNEWERTEHTSILTTGEFGTLYMDTVYLGYYSENEDGVEQIRGTVMERTFRWENPEKHLSLSDTVADPDCAIDYRMVIDDPEYTSKYLLRSYSVSDQKTRSLAETPEGELLWVEDAMISNGEPYRLVRSYPEYVRIRSYNRGELYAEELTDKLGKRISLSQYTYDEESRIERKETRDSNDNLIETYDYIYDSEGKHVKTVRNTYDTDGVLAETVTYDAEGNIIPPDAVPEPQPQPGGED